MIHQHSEGITRSGELKVISKMRECRNREINPAAFTKLYLPRECIRYSPKLLFGLWPEFFVLYDAFLKSAGTRRRFVISMFPLVPRLDETFSPRAICRRQCALPRNSQSFAPCVSLLSYHTLFLNAELSPSALPRSTISFRPVPFVPGHLPSFQALRLPVSYVPVL